MRKKKTERQKAINELDKWFSLFIRARDGYICFTCGASRVIMEAHRCVPQAGHLFSRSNYATRWDELNTHCQCSGCNMLHEMKPEKYTMCFLRKYGESAYEKLYIKHNTVFKISTQEINILADYYKHKYEELTRDTEQTKIRKED